MSKTPVETSVEVNFIVASHLSNLPAIATEAFTLNPIELLALSNSKTGIPAGACAHAAVIVVKTNGIVMPTNQLAFFMVFSVSVGGLNRSRPPLHFRNLARCDRGYGRHGGVLLPGATVREDRPKNQALTRYTNFPREVSPVVSAGTPAGTRWVSRAVPPSSNRRWLCHRQHRRAHQSRLPFLLPLSHRCAHPVP